MLVSTLFFFTLVVVGTLPGWLEGGRLDIGFLLFLLALARVITASKKDQLGEEICLENISILPLHKHIAPAIAGESVHPASPSTFSAVDFAWSPKANKFAV